MRLHSRGIRVLRGDGDAHRPDRQAFRERAAELVLCGDDGRRHAGLGHASQDGRRPELFVACHHHRLAGATIQVEISGDAMHRWRRAGDKGAVVRVREARQDRQRFTRETFLHDACEAGQLTRRKPSREIVGIAAVDADHRDRALRQRIGATIYRDRLPCEIVYHFVPPAFRARA